MKKKVCIFGATYKDYPRNVLVRKGFLDLGWDVIDCSDTSSGLKHYINLLTSFLKDGKKCQIIYIGVLGHYDLPLAWLLSKIYNKKIVFDAFYSLYDTYIEDRQIVNTFSFSAFRFYFYDWLSVRLANKVVLDTKENIDYFVKNYYVNKSKFFELPVTADPQILKLKENSKKKRKFKVGFYGSFLPLHGFEKIIAAASFTKNKKVKFYLLGKGPGVSRARDLIKEKKLNKKIIFEEKNLPYNMLPSFYQKIDLFLAGPFGDSEKATRVLPAKAVEALSVGIPSVISKNSATFRLLGNEKLNIIWLEENKAYKLAYIIDQFYQKPAVIKKGRFQDTKLGYKNFVVNLNNIIKF